MSHMFSTNQLSASLTHSFNQDISAWDVSFVKLVSFYVMIDMSRMFWSAQVFNQDISAWDVSNVISTYYMFCEARAFNQDLSSWNVSSVKPIGLYKVETSWFL